MTPEQVTLGVLVRVVLARVRATADPRDQVLGAIVSPRILDLNYMRPDLECGTRPCVLVALPAGTQWIQLEYLDLYP